MIFIFDLVFRIYRGYVISLWVGGSLVDEFGAAGLGGFGHILGQELLLGDD